MSKTGLHSVIPWRLIVTIRRKFAKVDTETKTDRDRREDVRKKTVQKQQQRFDCLSSEMNVSQAIVKPDCTKPKVLKSSGMKNALVKTVHEAISNTNEKKHFGRTHSNFPFEKKHSKTSNGDCITCNN
ncbi:hypothetical protein DPMN_136298 [Dreissena polymorpha]|uniref:Uncharacterized protein n=1 Tax=Dreissena polymorpha TaxID=45954 RepID=A0A9D4JDM8_DREPO|nr:hypothetical protein DPMN_136298 [Dreissena polymorpha]